MATKLLEVMTSEELKAQFAQHATASLVLSGTWEDHEMNLVGGEVRGNVRTDRGTVSYWYHLAESGGASGLASGCTAWDET